MLEFRDAVCVTVCALARHCRIVYHENAVREVLGVALDVVHIACWTDAERLHKESSNPLPALVLQPALVNLCNLRNHCC